MSDAEDLAALKAKRTELIALLGKQSYSIEDQSVSRGSLVAELRLINQMIQQLEPFEEIHQGYT